MQMILKRLKKEEKGFTLIELLAVIVILAVIAVIAVPLIGNIINKSKTDSDVATARQVYDAARLYITSEENGDFTSKSVVVRSSDTSAKTLVSSGYLESQIMLPSNKEVITGGVVKFNDKGELESVALATGNATVPTTTSTAANSKFYDGETVLKSGKK